MLKIQQGFHLQLLFYAKEFFIVLHIMEVWDILLDFKLLPYLYIYCHKVF